LKEGLRKGCRSQKVTRLVGTKRGSVEGTRWVTREGLRERCRGEKVTVQDTYRDRETKGRKDG
jgi:hypothetical protein